MKRDILQNKYRGNGLLRIFFADVVCFLVVAIFSVGFCYSYFSDKVEATGSTSTAMVTVDYRTVATNANTSTEVVRGKINSGSEMDITASTYISPGDKLTITGYAVNTSNVAVYVLAKLEVKYTENKGTDDEVESSDVKWYNIANSTALTTDAHGVYQIGASSLSATGTGTSYYQQLSIVYTFDGETFTNNHTIEAVNLTLHVYQQDYLDLADDYENYDYYATGTEGNRTINGYAVSSVYAAHHMTGNLLTSV